MNACLSEKISDSPNVVKYRNGKEEIGKKINKNVNTDENKHDSVNEEKEPRYLADEGPLKLAYGPGKEAPAASDGVSIAFSKSLGF